MKRKSLLVLLAATAFIAGGFVSCEDPGSTEDAKTLSVSPRTAIMFEARDNANVVLTVATTADTWNFTKPDWVTAEKSGDKLTVNVTDNTGAFRSGKIEFTAADAPAVIIGVGQAKAEVEVPDPTKVRVSMFDGSDENEKSFLMADEAISRSIYFSIPEAASADVQASVILDDEYLGEYNFANGVNHRLFPKELLTLGNGGAAVIRAGSKSSAEISVEIGFDASLIEHGVNYLLPLWFEVDSENGTVSNTRVNYIIRRAVQKDVKNICWMEINDGNPLNLLEYKLETGEYFWDALVMFSSNIIYDANEDIVKISHNPNNQALLDGAETYIKPLTDAGIKVYLSLLPHHTPAGLCNLSDWGSQQLAMEIAETVERYGLSGCAFDEEYVEGSWPSGTDWRNTTSARNGAYLMYQSKKAMKELCGEDRCDIAMFSFSTLSIGSITTSNSTFDGNEPADYIDIVNANYGGAGSKPAGTNGSLKQASYASIECNLGYYTGGNETSARTAKANGYGWCMWFAVNAGYTDADNHGFTTAKYNSQINAMKGVARGLYDKELVAPTHYYKKGKDGVYYSERFAY